MPSSPPLDDIFGYVAANVAGLTTGTNFFAGIMPDGPLSSGSGIVPDTCTALFEYPGGAPDEVFGAALPAVEEARFQVLCRDSEGNYSTNQNRIQTIYRTLITVGNQVINGTTYLRIQPIQMPFPLPRDEKRRVFHAVNVLVLRQPN